MSAEIIKFTLNEIPSRSQALGWLSINSIRFPDSVTGYVGKEMFFGWRFITALDGVIYFADCIHEGITINDLLMFKARGAQ